VDAKFRPDVVDQIGWFAEMVQVGKALNKSGRAVNRKGVPGDGWHPQGRGDDPRVGQGADDVQHGCGGDG